MSRRKAQKERPILPDAKYGSVLLARFINCLMYDGKKYRAEDIVYKAIESVAEKTGLDPLIVFKEAIKNVSPVTCVRSRRIGGATYQIPETLKSNRSVRLAMRWLIETARASKERIMFNALVNVIIAAHNGTGDAVKKRDDMHKMAEANKAFSHFRW